MSDNPRTIEKGCGAVLPGGHAWFHPACRSCAEHGFAPRPTPQEAAQPIRVGDEFEAMSAAPGYQPQRCRVVVPPDAEPGAEGWCAVTYSYAPDVRSPVRAVALLDPTLWRRIARPAAAQPAHEPPATVTLRWCSECGQSRHPYPGVPDECPGTVQALTYKLDPEPRTDG